MYSTRMINQLAIKLLEGLRIKNPSFEQCKAAECFVISVILPPTRKEFISQKNLTPKESICLNLAASGFSTEETANMLALAKGTIKNYRERIRQKLECKSITEAVYKAFVSIKENGDS